MSVFQTMSSPAPCTPGLLICALLIACAASARLPFRSPIFVEENALSPVAKYGGSTTYQERDWVKIRHSGPRMNRVSPGGRVELECEASGSPPPNLQWFHNGIPVSQELDESNSIGSLRLGNVKSRLFIDCATPRHHGAYVCVANSGTETVESQPSFLFVQGNNASGLLPSCSHKTASPPRITAWSSNVMETAGNDVVLPCMNVGNPPPQVYWIDNHNNIISSGPDSQSDERYKVLESGDLVIPSVRWADMGQFTCVVESPLGRDTISTFLYPMSKDR